jgi:flavin reductase (DIM6/NTAB) family NADH-FMN oxidoreductase RutF
MSRTIAALFQRLTQGVYVVGVAHGGVRNAFTAAWVMQVSFDPLLLTLSINPHHSSYRLLKEGRAFSVNVLKKGQLDLAEHMVSRPAPTNWLGQSGRRTARASLCCVRHWPGSSASS